MSAPAGGNGAGPAIDAGAIRSRAKTLGIDLVGFCSWPELEAEAPDYDKPSQLSTYLTRLIVLAKRYPTGVARSPDAAFRQYANGRVARHLEEAAGGLAYWLEQRDAIACILSAAIPDLRRQPMAYAGPGGQGSLLLRQAAAASGLGTLGLNEMILTPEYGPRVFLAGVLTDAAVDCGQPLEEDLCPGLDECGRCAEVCPVAAIPDSAPAGAPLAEVRDPRRRSLRPRLPAVRPRSDGRAPHRPVRVEVRRRGGRDRRKPGNAADLLQPHRATAGGVHRLPELPDRVPGRRGLRRRLIRYWVRRRPRRLSETHEAPHWVRRHPRRPPETHEALTGCAGALAGFRATPRSGGARGKLREA